MTTSLQNLGIKPDLRPEVRVRMGRKGDRGGVVEKDRFHLCTGRASGAGMRAVSDPHPSFAAFNGAEARYRQELRGTLIHARWEAPGRHGDGSIWSRFDAARLPGHEVPPGMRPCCSGDGARARRWVRGKWTDIACPGDACQFRQPRLEGKNEVTDCKRISTLVFQLRWLEGASSRPLPSCPAFIESGGPWSYATMQWWGFYQGIQAQWVQMGGAGEPDLYGLPIRLSLQRRTVPGRGAEVWVPELYTDFAAGQTLQGFLAWRAAQAEAARPLLAGTAPLALPGAVLGARGTVEVGYTDVQADPVEPPVRGGR